MNCAKCGTKLEYVELKYIDTGFTILTCVNTECTFLGVPRLIKNEQ